MLLLKIPDGNFFNWLLFNNLPKVMERGADYIVQVSLVRALCMLKKGRIVFML